MILNNDFRLVFARKIVHVPSLSIALAVAV